MAFYIIVIAYKTGRKNIRLMRMTMTAAEMKAPLEYVFKGRKARKH